MQIIDWSSVVCSSELQVFDLRLHRLPADAAQAEVEDLLARLNADAAIVGNEVDVTTGHAPCRDECFDCCRTGRSPFLNKQKRCSSLLRFVRSLFFVFIISIV